MTECMEIKNLSYRYPDGTLALDGLSLTIPLPSRTFILGSNGCGKSTLLRHLNGLIVPEAGSVTIAGRQLTKKTANSIRQNVGLLFDNPDTQIFSPSVAADVRFGPVNLRLKPEEISRRVEEALRTVELRELAEKSPYNLSLGQKKRCAIAGVLAMEPRILLLDEPFSGLDAAALRQFLHTLSSLYDTGVTQIVSTHDVDLAYEWAEYVVIMERGRVKACGGRELMRDADLMSEAGLDLPLLVRLFQGMGQIPDSLEQARQWIDPNIRRE
ncbi:MAG: ATP-binding cassette domain-containing protein [Firmicutes bacterium]|nr:ATP-binding cassette domain-containing protein [Bacillota bacterium]